MQRTAVVVEDLGNQIKEIEVSRQTACEGCSQNGHCHACVMLGDQKKSRELRSKAFDPLGCRVGDRVVVETDSSTVIKYAAEVFLLPLVLGAVGYLLGEKLAEFVSNGKFLPLICSLVGFAAAFIYVKLVPARRAEKKCDVKIVRILNQG